MQKKRRKKTHEKNPQKTPTLQETDELQSSFAKWNCKENHSQKKKK